MDKRPLIGVSLCAVVLLVLGSLSNVVGYQSVKSSNQQIINEEINQKDLLFQTIVDIANNKEIQQIILKSQINKGGLFNPEGIFPGLNTPVLMKNRLEHMYTIGLLLSKFISKSRMQLMIGKYQFNNQEIQKEINDVIEKNAPLNREIKQLSCLKCDCDKDNLGVTRWNFPILCAILIIIIAIIEGSPALGFLFRGFLLILWGIAGTLGC
jgi:hypothetical protein